MAHHKANTNNPTRPKIPTNKASLTHPKARIHPKVPIPPRDRECTTNNNRRAISPTTEATEEGGMAEGGMIGVTVVGGGVEGEGKGV